MTERGEKVYDRPLGEKNLNGLEKCRNASQLEGPLEVCSHKFKVRLVSVVAHQPFVLVWIHLGRKASVGIKQMVFFPDKYNQSSEKQGSWC